MSEDFFIPNFDAVSDSPVCARGRHPVTATGFEASYSKQSHNPMMIVEWTVDAGSEAGHTLVDYIVFGARGRFGERKLKKICTIAGYKWRQKENLEEFVSQFPKNTWRMAVEVGWQFSKKVGPKQWEEISEEEYEKLDVDDERNIRANIVDYYSHEGSEDEERLLFSDEDIETEVVFDSSTAPWE